MEPVFKAQSMEHREDLALHGYTRQSGPPSPTPEMSEAEQFRVVF